ncbi:PaaI family thioesterase [Brevibacterium daeguense]|nr:PaaI family thioesterase [Brevibacterium daeguense]
MMPTPPFTEYTARLTRELIHTLVAETDEARLAEHVAFIADKLAEAAARPQQVTVADPHRSAGHIPDDITPASSARNPIAPPMLIEWDGDESRCELTLPLQYQGPPGRVHGGIVATMLDHVLGNAANAGGRPRSYTRYLNVSYDAATPVGEPLVVVGRTARHDGRKRFMEGEILCHGEVRVRAEGLWIEPREGLGHRS